MCQVVFFSIDNAIMISYNYIDNREEFMKKVSSILIAFILAFFLCFDGVSAKARHKY